MSIHASIADLQRTACKRLPKPFRDYLENGSFTGATLRANREDLQAVKLRQNLLGSGIQQANTHSSMLGQATSLPVALSPVGLSGANRGNGEVMAARAALDFGVPYCLSTFSLASIEDIAAAVGDNFWFQLYPMQDEKINLSLLNRARKAGCPVLIITVDAQVAGTRYRDIHNGLGMPPRLTTRNILEMAGHPRWAWSMLQSPHWTFGNMLGEASHTKQPGTLADWIKTALKPDLDADFLARIRQQWPGKLIIKGILSIEDMRMAHQIGADAIVVSNHGGRQLDGGMSTVRALPGIAAAAPAELKIYVDSGIRTGIDILRFLGLGADGCFIGRAYNYGLAADGQTGVHQALAILQDELQRSMYFTGTPDLAHLPRDLIAQAPEPAC